MIIVGAKGFAKQLVEIFYQNKELENLFFFDDVYRDLPEELYGIKIIKSKEEVINIFQTVGNKFCLGLGGPLNRQKVTKQFESLGGELSTVISEKAFIAKHIKLIGKGTTILTSSIVENDTILGVGVLLNSFAAVYHDCIIGDFCEIAPGAKVLGEVIMGNNCLIGANATILPKIKIVDNCIIGAGAIVINDVPANSTVVGVPAKRIEK